MRGLHGKFQKATLTMLGSIIGAGVFGLPAMFAQSGFWPATLLFFLLTLATLGMHLLFVEVIFAFPEKQRLAGYAKKIGKIGGGVAAIAYPLFCMGVSFAYLILGGEFLFAIAERFGIALPVLAWQVIFWTAIALAVLVGLRFVAKVEAFATWLLIASMVFIIGFSLPHAEPSRLLFSSWGNVLYPFGVFLFSLSGITVVGEVVEIARPSRRRSFVTVALGTIIAALLSWLFGASLYLVAGSQAWEPAELILRLPGGWGWLIPVFGFLAIATSYVTLAQDFKATLHLDFRFPKILSWFLALMIPFVLLFFVPRRFLTTIDLVGAVFGGLNGVLVGWMAWHVLRRSRTAWLWRAAVPFFVMVAFGIGIFYKFVYHSLV